MIKLYIEEVFYPWITWPHDLYKHINAGNTDLGFEITPNLHEADVLFLNDSAVNIFDQQFVTDKPTFVFIDKLGISVDDELKVLGKVKYANDNNWVCVTESLALYEKLVSVRNGLEHEPWLWRRPSRIPRKQIDTQHNQTDCDNTIIAVFDAKHPLSHAADLVKAYLGATVILDEEHSITIDLKIFSATELPFEPFNDVRFEGFTTNRKLHEAMKKAALFIWPCEFETYPSTLLEAAQMGIPCLQFMPAKTPIKLHTVHHDNQNAQYVDVDDLTQKIVAHFVAMKDANYFNDIVPLIKTKNIREESMEFGLEMFLIELDRRLSENTK